MKTIVVFLLAMFLLGCQEHTPTTYNIIKDSERIINKEMRLDTRNSDYHIFNLTLNRTGDLTWEGEFIDIYGDMYSVLSEIENGMVKCRWARREHVLDTVKLSNGRMYINGMLQ